MAKRTNNTTTTITFDANVAGVLGQEMATAAHQQVVGAVSYWDRCRTVFSAAQAQGKGQEAFDAIFGPGEKVKGKKAPWYRTYKSILSNALQHGVTIGQDMGMSAAQAAVKEAKDNAADAGDKAAKLVEMFTKMAQGCLNAGVSKAKLDTIIKGLDA